MSRSIQRRTLAARLLIGWVLLAVVVSFAGIGYAVPSAADDKGSGETSSTPVPKTPGDPQEDPGKSNPPSEEPAQPPTTDPVDPGQPVNERPAPETPVEVPVAEEPVAPAPQKGIPATPDTDAKPAAEKPSDPAVVVPTAVTPVPAPATQRGCVPVLVDGNPVCSVAGHNLFKIDSQPAAGTYTVAPGKTITLTSVSASGFNFTSSGILIYDVIVKASSGANWYHYDANGFDGVTWDNWLKTVQKSDGGFYGISHVSFCWKEIPQHEKTFSLTMEGSVPVGTTFLVKYKVGGVEATPLALTGGNPFTAKVTLAHGSVISDVRWYAVWNGEQVLLGTTAGETLTSDKTNSFTYGGLLDGHKYEDLNANGSKQAGEPGLSGWVIVLERQMANGSWLEYGRKTTDANGYYKFDNVLPGTYRVSEVMKTDYDWTQSMPGTTYYNLTFGAGSSSSAGTQHRNKDFMNWAPASIEGFKFEDLNGDGERDEGEDGLDGWLIYVDYDGDDEYDDGVEPFDITDTNGYYFIEDILPGSYEVREQLLSGWSQSRGSFTVVFESRHHCVSETGAYDFGNWEDISKSGVKFEDLNADGAKDSGEPGLAGWTIFVDYDDDGELDTDEPSAITGANGAYTIYGIRPGTWNVREVMQTDVTWTQSMPGGPDFAYNEEFASGDEIFGNDFGNWAPAEIHGMKFNDLDADGTNDSEPGLEGWRIFVDYDGDGAWDDPDEPSDVTDSDGEYDIYGVTPGTWNVCEVLEADWTQSRGTFQVTFESRGVYGAEDGDYDFGNYELCGLFGYKFEDVAGDGESTGDPGLENWEIHLDGTTGAGDPVHLVTYTDENGYYEFTDLIPGQYTVSEVLQTGWTQSFPALGDYDVELSAGEYDETSYDFANFEDGSLYGYKYHDLEADGDITGDPGLENWEIHLDGTTGAGDPLHLVAYTDEDGYYEFLDVPPGDYTISEVGQLLWTQSYPAVPGTYSVGVSSGEDDEESYDFGNWTPGKKYGTKFEDLNADGDWDTNESGLANWIIYVDYNNDGDLDTDEPFALTGTDGSYELTGIQPGSWWIREVMKVDEDWHQSMPSGPDFGYYEVFSSQTVYRDNNFGNWVPATITGMKFEDVNGNGENDDDPGLAGWRIYVDYDGDDEYDTGVEPSDVTDADGVYFIGDITPGTYEVREVLESDWTQTKGTFTVTFESRGDYSSETGDYDFGNWERIEKFGMKFEDMNADGDKDAGEQGLSGWTIFVDYDDDGELDADEPSAVTGADGSYTITDIVPGTWKVREVMQTDVDWHQSMPGAPGFAYTEAFTSGEDYLDNDFGNWAPASITGMKFGDTDGDGVNDPAESGLSGWRIYVDYDGDETYDDGVEPSDVTDADGVYEITGITPGTYFVREVLEADWTQSRGTFEVTFESRGAYASEEGEYDFGNYESASLRGYKLEDLNADGDVTGDPGLAGWTIVLEGTAGDGTPVLLTTTTDADGYYEFTDLKPGTYTVHEQGQSGWTQSYPASIDYDVELSSGENDEYYYTFGNWTPIDIHGLKKEDLNADGDISGDPVLESWEIHLDGTTGWGDPVHLVDYTDEDGYYEFADVPPGSYTISEVAQLGWQQSFPGGDGDYDVDLYSSDEPGSYDFGNWGITKKSGVKFEDMDADGVRDTEDLGLAGWVIYVDYDNDSEFDAGEPFAITDASGFYEIQWVLPGTWTIREVMKVDYDWTQSLPGGPTFGYSEDFQSQTEHTDNNFGNWRPASIEGMKYHDLDADGVNEDEPGLAGWRIYVDYDGDDEYDAGVESTDVTDADGRYEITDITPGTYEVREVLDADWSQSQGNFLMTFYSNGHYVAEESEYDFGNWTTTELSGYKYHDTDADGDIAGEPTLEGWEIRLDGTTGWGSELHLVTYTDENGYYEFTDLPPGDYVISEVLQDGWTQSYPSGQNAAVASVAELGPYTWPVDASSGQEFEQTFDFGNWTTTELSGYKYHDTDADGDIAGEPTLEGWEIRLDGTTGWGSELHLVTYTDENGYYEFTDVPPGEYVVSEATQGGWTQSYPSDGDYDIVVYSDAEPEASMDFGNWTTTELSGYKYHDTDADGDIAGEPTLEGWEIRLDGTTGWGSELHLVTYTDENGYYEFTDLPPGDYVVSEVIESGWFQSYPVDPGTYDVDLESAMVPEVSFDFGNWTTGEVSGIKFFDADGDGAAREEGEITLPDWVIYVDYDNDGVADADEPFDVTDANGAYTITGILPGAWVLREVLLEDWNNTYPAEGQYDLVVGSWQSQQGFDFGNTTHVTKTFELTYLGTPPEGVTFWVRFEIAGEVFTLQLEAAGEGLYTVANDVWPQTVIENVEWLAEYQTELIALGAGADSELIDADMINEFTYDASVMGHKWNDTDYTEGLPGDGTWQPTEPALANWEIELYRQNMSNEWVLYATDTTDADGLFSFDYILPGTYFLAEVIPVDANGMPMWTQSAGPSGEGDEAFVIVDGSEVGPVDFGNWEPFEPFTEIDAGLVKVVDQSDAAPADLLTYTLTYTMVSGDVAADGSFTVTDDYDERYLSVVDAAGGVVADGMIVWTVDGPLAEGESGTITYTMRVNNNMPDGKTEIANRAVIRVPGDSNPANDRDDAMVTVEFLPYTPPAEPFLPFTGANIITVLLFSFAALVLGTVLRRSARSRAQ